MKRTVRVVTTAGAMYELDFEPFTHSSVTFTDSRLICHHVARIRVHTSRKVGETNFPVDRWEINLSKVVRIVFDSFPYRALPAAEVLADYGVAKRLGITDRPVAEFDDLAQCPKCEHTFPVRVSVY